MASRPLRAGDPRRLGDYRLLARLGSGGMGTVYLARDLAGHHVAIKTIRPEHAENEEFRARFRSEVNRARQVPSFCTATVLDADPDSETPYLVTEYVDGPSLQEVVEDRGAVAAGDLHSVAVGVAAALTAIHGAGVIHRDLKPSNVLLSLGLPKVIDFGIARALETTRNHTRPGHFVGTVDYMAPERLDSSVGPVSAAADIFAWGAVIVFAGTGRIPFHGENTVATATRILTQPPDLDGLPDSLADLVERSLTKDPLARPTASELVQGLLAVSTPPAAAPTAGRPLTGRFDARELLEQVVGEQPQRRPVAPQPTIRRRRATGATTRRLIYVLGALIVTSVTVGTVAYARTTGRPDGPATGPRTALAPAQQTAGSSSFVDALDRPGRFRAGTGTNGRCGFTDGRLWARARPGSTFQCPGPVDPFAGDQTIGVEVELVRPDACAMVFFRFRGDRGYQLTACAATVEVEKLGGVVLTSVGKEASTALTFGVPHRLVIAIVADHATVTVDGKEVLQANVTDPALRSGRLQLGVTNTSPTSEAEVAFGNLRVDAG
jgi:eukaryotic-like serine/threonine-protein kinase